MTTSPFVVTGSRSCLLAGGIGLGAYLLFAPMAVAGKARDYLNAPKDTWVTFYNLGRSESVAPVVGGAEFGISDATTDILSQSFILTRIIDVGGRTGGLSVILPHVGGEILLRLADMVGARRLLHDFSEIAQRIGPDMCRS